MSNDLASPYICITCAYQQRVADEDEGDRCIHPEPHVAGATCDGYRLLPAQLLGERLAELYETVHTLSEMTLELAEAVQVYL